jgi:hypothetical protein
LSCRELGNELTERARRGAALSSRLSAHLPDCRQCNERWEAELALSAEMRKLRLTFAGERSPDWRRRQLMAEFSSLERARPRSWFRWAWVPAAAAVLVVASFQIWRGAPPGNAGGQSALAVADSTESGSAEISEANGFIPVPYAPPLAAGESVRIVRRAVNRAELVRMGIDLPGGYTDSVDDDFEADVVLGEDELPRAVQLVGYAEY